MHHTSSAHYCLDKMGFKEKASPSSIIVIWYFSFLFWTTIDVSWFLVSICSQTLSSWLLRSISADDIDMSDSWCSTVCVLFQKTLWPWDLHVSSVCFKRSQKMTIDIVHKKHHRILIYSEKWDWNGIFSTTPILQRHLCKLIFNPIQSLKIRDLVIMRYRCYFGNQRECSYCDLFHCTEFLIPRGTATPSSRLIQVIAKLDLWFLCHFKSATIPISVTHTINSI